VTGAHLTVSAGKQTVVDQLSSPASAIAAIDPASTVNYSMSTTHILEQVFGDTAVAQESFIAQPGAILISESSDQVGMYWTDMAIFQPYSAAQQDGVPTEWLDPVGQTGPNDLGVLAVEPTASPKSAVRSWETP
jgi:hypothetical protein